MNNTEFLLKCYLQIIFLIHQLFVWLIKHQKNVHHNFLELKSPKPKNIP